MTDTTRETGPTTTRAATGSGPGATAKIRLEGVGKVYPGTKTPAVEELTMEIATGEILVLVGPSGCGKSTTLRLINRMIEPTSGRILLDGEDVTRVNPDHLRRRIGYVIQQVGLFPHQTIAQNIATVPKMLGWPKQKIADRTEYLLGAVGLDPQVYRGRFPRELSGGQAQRVGVARALGADPDIMLMDEPFGAIDPITRDKLQNEFLRVQEELHKTIVFVTHDIDEAIKMGDRIAILGERSTIRQIDTPERILAYPVDDFVSDFIGEGTTIKGLNFLEVGALQLDTYPSVIEGASTDEARNKLEGTHHEWIIVTDSEARPRRWVARDQLDGGSLDGLGEEIGERYLRSDNTLFEALEWMVQSAAGMTPVIDGAGRFTGCVDMADLNRSFRRAQIEAQRHYEDLEAQG